MLLLADTEPALVSVALSEIDAMIRVPGKRAGRGALERLLVRTR